MMQVVQDHPKGWMCPSCGRAHGPHVDTCPGPQQAVSPGLPTIPNWTWPAQPYVLPSPYTAPDYPAKTWGAT